MHDTAVKTFNIFRFVLACSQTLYFLFKVASSARDKKQKPLGICWPPVEGVRGGEGENSLFFFLALRARFRSPMFSKERKEKENNVCAQASFNLFSRFVFFF